MWKLPERGYELTSGLGRTFTFIIFEYKTLEERLEDMKRYIDSLEVK